MRSRFARDDSVFAGSGNERRTRVRVFYWGMRAVISTEVKGINDNTIHGFTCGSRLYGAGCDRGRAISDGDHRPGATQRAVRAADQVSTRDGTSVTFFRADG